MTDSVKILNDIAAKRNAVARVARLRSIEAAAREFITSGLKLTVSNEHRLTVIESPDKSDPHYKLCEALASEIF